MSETAIEEKAHWSHGLLRLTNVDLGWRPTHTDAIIGMVFHERDGTKDWELWEVWLGEPRQDGIIGSINYYRIENCKPAGIMYCHLSGGGPINSRSGEDEVRELNKGAYEGLLLWLAPNVERPWQIAEDSPQLLKAVPGFVTQEFLNEIYDHGELDFYCSECNSMIPGDWAHLCRHSWWCEICGAYSTPSERCGHEPGQEEDDDGGEDPDEDGDSRPRNPDV